MTVTTQQTDASHFEKCLITHCSPVLAGIKSANLMNITVTAPQCFLEMLLSYDRTLREKGVSVTLLRYENHRALVYVYRKQKLLKELRKPGVVEFLQAQGYSSLELEALLSRLRERLQTQEEFPHEIGLFLGYPLHDVVGFIENEGRNCCCVGCWKVYDCVCEAQKLFAKFQKCREVYTQQFRSGKSLLRLTVAA